MNARWSYNQILYVSMPRNLTPKTRRACLSFNEGTLTHHRKKIEQTPRVSTSYCKAIDIRKTFFLAPTAGWLTFPRPLSCPPPPGH